MILTLDKVLVDLDGQPIKDGQQDAKMFRFVAKALGTAQNDDPIKSYDLALKFYSGVAVELDDSDVAFVRETVFKSAYIPIIKGALLKEIDHQRLIATKA